ncbi:hypothetical protein RB653_002737 [Dictyostelium firmibasis]|uniref:EF-hand domain-containing protein n=1 Tax=Dictyostelium firmibasis TaxID=79012 RepID=A0AAN7YNA7_9MYCE
MVNQQLSKESDIFLISNRFDEKEIKIFENLFNSIDLDSKGYICKEDFDQYKNNKTELKISVDFEKILIFNNSTITFNQFLSLLSLTGISLNITTPPIENESKPISSGYSRLSFIPTSVAQQQQILQLFNNNNSSNSPQFSFSNSTPVQFNNSPSSPQSILTSTHISNSLSSTPTTTTILESTSIETIGKGGLNNIGLNNNTDSDNENKRTSKMGLGGHRGNKSSIN